MPSNPSPLHSLSALGQSVWIDSLSRGAIRGGHLQQLIDEDAVVGATSNPSIFQKAMGSGEADYDEQLRELGTDDVEQAFWTLAEESMVAAITVCIAVTGSAHTACDSIRQSGSSAGPCALTM